MPKVGAFIVLSLETTCFSFVILKIIRFHIYNVFVVYKALIFFITDKDSKSNMHSGNFARHRSYPKFF